MADGSSGGLGGVLFEAGKNAAKATGTGLQNQATAAGNSAFSSLTGSQKQLFGAKSQAPASKPLGQLPKQNPFGNLGDFGKMFEGGAKSPFGSKTPNIPSAPQISQAEIDAMTAQNKIQDDQKIAEAQRELQLIKQQHQQLHNEVYYNKIAQVGQHTMEQDRQARAQQQEQDDLQKQQDAQTKQMDVLPGGPLAQNGQLGNLPQKPNMATQQAMTKRETGHGTSG